MFRQLVALMAACKNRKYDDLDLTDGEKRKQRHLNTDCYPREVCRNISV